MDANTKEVLLSVVALASPVISALSYYYFHSRSHCGLEEPDKTKKGGTEIPPKE